MMTSQRRSGITAIDLIFAGAITAAAALGVAQWQQRTLETSMDAPQSIGQSSPQPHAIPDEYASAIREAYASTPATTSPEPITHGPYTLPPAPTDPPRHCTPVRAYWASVLNDYIQGERLGHEALTHFYDVQYDAYPECFGGEHHDK